MQLAGHHFLGGGRSAEAAAAFSAVNPANQEELAPKFCEATAAEVDQALQLADAAFDVLQTVQRETIACLLELIADGLNAARDPLLARAAAETALPRGRLEVEHDRTVGHCRAFSAMVRDGGWVQARIDHADSARQPLAKPELRTMLCGVGPVVVFGASNFPLAISVAGTDTISALAARCPVIVKGHPAHPGTCEMVANCIAQSVAAMGLPGGTFSLLQGAGHELGRMLVEHPLTAAVAFTGSLRGGRALYDVSVRRPYPIPFYAEMGSTNPVFILPGAARERPEAIAAGYVQSVTMGVGQYCTNPGLLFMTGGADFDRFAAATARAAAAAAPATMLHRGIYTAYKTGLARLNKIPGLTLLGQSENLAADELSQVACTISLANFAILAEHPELTEELFGPESVVFRCQSVAEMLTYARSMEPQLTATIHGTPADLLEYFELVRALQRKVGRIVFNGFPTGLEVCPALHHGGPYPATTHGNFTSVGQYAIYRFVRPICYQGFPQECLPEELQDVNPLGIPRVVDGRLSM